MIKLRKSFIVSTHFDKQYKIDVFPKVTSSSAEEGLYNIDFINKCTIADMNFELEFAPTSYFTTHRK